MIQLKNCLLDVKQQSLTHFKEPIINKSIYQSIIKNYYHGTKYIDKNVTK